MFDDSITARFERIKARVELEIRRQDIICPYCDRTQDNESKYRHVTYWGEEPEFEVTCESATCGKKFFVREEVQRQFITRKDGEEFEE